MNILQTDCCWFSLREQIYFWSIFSGLSTVSSITTIVTIKKWNGSCVWQVSIAYFLVLRWVSELPVKDGYVDISSSCGLHGCYFQKWTYSLPELRMVMKDRFYTGKTSYLCATWLEVHTGSKESQSLKSSLVVSSMLRCERTKNCLESGHLLSPLLSDGKPSFLDGWL